MISAEDQEFPSGASGSIASVVAGNDVYTWGNKARGRLGNDDKDALSPCCIDVTASGSLQLVSAAASNGGALIALGNVD